MKPKTLIPAFLAVLLGVAAAILVRHSMTRPKPGESIAVAPKMVPSVVATSDLMAGQEILGENVEVTEIASTNPPQDVIGSPTEVTGRILSAPVAKGQPIRQSSLAVRGAPPTLISLVPPGMRAITVNVDEGNTFSGMLLPGSHVDVLGSVASGRDSLSRTLMTNILVQAVGQRLTSARSEDGKEPPPFHAITLIVTPRQAQMIDLAGQNARMRLLLRPLGRPSPDEQPSDKVTFAELMGTEDKPAATPTPTPTPVAYPATQPSTTTTEVAKVAMVTPVQTTRDVTFIVGSTVTHVKLEMPQEVAPTPVQAGTNDLRDPIIPGPTPSEGAEPRQE